MFRFDARKNTPTNVSHAVLILLLALLVWQLPGHSGRCPGYGKPEHRGRQIHRPEKRRPGPTRFHFRPGHRRLCPDLPQRDLHHGQSSRGHQHDRVAGPGPVQHLRRGSRLRRGPAQAKDARNPAAGDRPAHHRPARHHHLVGAGVGRREPFPGPDPGAGLCAREERSTTWWKCAGCSRSCSKCAWRRCSAAWCGAWGSISTT
jgi:hypothetical protein